MFRSGLEAMSSSYSNFPYIFRLDEICQAFYLYEFAIVSQFISF